MDTRRMMSVVAQSGRPVGSNGKVHMRFASVIQWADYIVLRVMAYTEVDEARAAAQRLAGERG
jgi:hypothetical protein